MLHPIMAPDDDRELIGRLFSNEVPPFVAARDELLASVERWRVMVRDGPPGPNTHWFGVAMRAVTLAEVLMRQAVDVVAPDGEVPAKATLGDLRQTLDRHGRRVKMSCLGLPRMLITDTDIAAVGRLVAARNAVAHNAETVAYDPRHAGHSSTGDVLGLLDRVEEFARLPLFDELECRDRRVRARGSEPVD